MKVLKTIIFLTIFIFAGCGDKKEPVKKEEQPLNHSYSKTEFISARQGGTLKLGKAAISIPKQALDKDSEVKITIRNKRPKIKPDSKIRYLGNTYEITSSSSLRGNVTITLPYNIISNISPKKEEKFFIGVWDGVKWNNLGGKVDKINNTISVEVAHLSLFSVLGDIFDPIGSYLASLSSADLEISELPQAIKDDINNLRQYDNVKIIRARTAVIPQWVKNSVLVVEILDFLNDGVFNPLWDMLKISIERILVEHLAALQASGMLTPIVAGGGIALYYGGLTSAGTISGEAILTMATGTLGKISVIPIIGTFLIKWGDFLKSQLPKAFENVWTLNPFDSLSPEKPLLITAVCFQGDKKDKDHLYLTAGIRFYYFDTTENSWISFNEKATTAIIELKAKSDPFVKENEFIGTSIVHSESEKFFTISRDNSLDIYSSETFQKKLTTMINCSGNVKWSFSPKDKYILVSCKEGEKMQLNIIELETGKSKFSETRDFIGYSFSPRDSYFVFIERHTKNGKWSYSFGHVYIWMGGIMESTLDAPRSYEWGYEGEIAFTEDEKLMVISLEPGCRVCVSFANLYSFRNKYSLPEFIHQHVTQEYISSKFVQNGNYFHVYGGTMTQGWVGFHGEIYKLSPYVRSIKKYSGSHSEKHGYKDVKLMDDRFVVEIDFPYVKALSLENLRTHWEINIFSHCKSPNDTKSQLDDYGIYISTFWDRYLDVSLSWKDKTVTRLLYDLENKRVICNYERVRPIGYNEYIFFVKDNSIDVYDKISRKIIYNRNFAFDRQLILVNFKNQFTEIPYVFYKYDSGVFYINPLTGQSRSIPFPDLKGVTILDRARQVLLKSNTKSVFYSINKEMAEKTTKMNGLTSKPVRTSYPISSSSSSTDRDYSASGNEKEKKVKKEVQEEGLPDGFKPLVSEMDYSDPASYGRDTNIPDIDNWAPPPGEKIIKKGYNLEDFGYKESQLSQAFSEYRVIYRGENSYRLLGFSKQTGTWWDLGNKKK